jgi:hypothetical protein
MSNDMQHTEGFEKLVAALEKILLESSDAALLSSAPSSDHEVTEVRHLVDEALKRHGISELVSRGRQKTSRPVRVPSDLRGRIRVLQRLMQRSDLAPRISSVLSGAGVPSDKEVNELTDELTRLGVLKPDRK